MFLKIIGGLAGVYVAGVTYIGLVASAPASTEYTNILNLVAATTGTNAGMLDSAARERVWILALTWPIPSRGRILWNSSPELIKAVYLTMIRDQFLADRARGGVRGLAGPAGISVSRGPAGPVLLVQGQAV